MLTFDNDPRLVGSPAGRDFPSALVRFLLCLGVQPNVIPPHRPDLNAYVERDHSFECLRSACRSISQPRSRRLLSSPRRFSLITTRSVPIRRALAATNRLVWPTQHFRPCLLFPRPSILTAGSCRSISEPLRGPYGPGAISPSTAKTTT
jgi:hypothetical protein